MANLPLWQHLGWPSSYCDTVPHLAVSFPALFAEERQKVEDADAGDLTGTSNTAKLPDEGKADDYFQGEVTSNMRKVAVSKGMNKIEIANAVRAANEAVMEALRGPGEIPNPSPEQYYSEACDVILKGLPLIGSRQQRCCKMDKVQALKVGGVPPGMVTPRKFPNRDRNLEAEEGEGGLPAVQKTEGTESVRGGELACFPSFVIAGTQKSGTTALAGEWLLYSNNSGSSTRSLCSP